MTTKHSGNGSGSGKTARVITHVAFEDLGSFEQTLREADYDVAYVRAGSDDLGIIRPENDDLLVIMGGPISVNDTGEYPFLKTELEILRERLAADRPTLGICLGAQLIASALGAAVYPGPHKEIGWSPVQLTGAGSRSVLRHLVGDNVRVLHWHGETFDIPEGAELLASTELYEHQAFVYGNTLALQFHPEVSAKALEQWYIGHTVEIHQTPGLSVRQLRDDARRFAEILHPRAYLFMDEWLDQVEADASA